MNSHILFCRGSKVSGVCVCVYLCVSVHVCVRACACVCVIVWMRAYVIVHACVRACVCVCMIMRMRVYVIVQMCVCVIVHVRARPSVCVCVCACMHTCVRVCDCANASAALRWQPAALTMCQCFQPVSKRPDAVWPTLCGAKADVLTGPKHTVTSYKGRGDEGWGGGGPGANDPVV